MHLLFSVSYSLIALTLMDIVDYKLENCISQHHYLIRSNKVIKVMNACTKRLFTTKIHRKLPKYTSGVKKQYRNDLLCFISFLYLDLCLLDDTSIS